MTAARSTFVRRALVALLALAATSAAADWQRTKTTAEARFKGKGPVGYRIEGVTGDVSVKEDAESVTVTVSLTKLTTDMDLRDDHMRNKYLEVGKFPETKLMVKKAALKMPAGAGKIEGKAKGMYTLHGQAKELEFSYTGDCKADLTCDVTGEMPVNFNEFGIFVPSYAGITVKPDIVVSTKFQVKSVAAAPAPAPSAPTAAPAAPAASPAPAAAPAAPATH